MSRAKQDITHVCPSSVADKFLAEQMQDGLSKLRHYRQGCHTFENGAFNDTPKDEVRGTVTRWLADRFQQVTTSTIGNVLEHVRATTMLRGDVDPPFWICPKRNDWNPSEILVTRNTIVHLPTLETQPATPRLFVQCATSFDYKPDPPPALEWLDFLQQVFDPEAIDALRMWFGYCLANDTTQQKMLCIFGPKRSGKGTVVRVLTELVGRRNVASPTLSSLSTPFGLQPMIGKTLATIADARIGRRTDEAAIAERILSITGEDGQTIDRKYIQAITVRLPVRLVLVSNELPKILDASGALQSRMIVLQTLRSFEGREDLKLEEKLRAELPGILMWSIAGWLDLQRTGRLMQPESGRTALEQWGDISSPVGAFVRDCCEVTGEVKCKVIYAAFRGWAEEAGHKHFPTQETFGRDLKAVIGATKVRVRDGSDRPYVYRGVSMAASQTSF
jgi:putative DNA primase/helicase